MAIKFVDSLPKAKRSSSATPAIAADDVEELKANPKKWAQVATNVTNGQKYGKFCDENPGFVYTAIASGEKVKNQKGIEVGGFNVYVAYDPEAAEEREAKKKALAAKKKANA